MIDVYSVKGRKEI